MVLYVKTYSALVSSRKCPKNTTYYSFCLLLLYVTFRIWQRFSSHVSSYYEIVISYLPPILWIKNVPHVYLSLFSIDVIQSLFLFLKWSLVPTRFKPCIAYSRVLYGNVSILSLEKNAVWTYDHFLYHAEVLIGSSNVRVACKYPSVYAANYYTLSIFILGQSVLWSAAQISRKLVEMSLQYPSKMYVCRVGVRLRACA